MRRAGISHRAEIDSQGRPDIPEGRHRAIYAGRVQGNGPVYFGGHRRRASVGPKRRIRFPIDGAP